MRKIVCLVLFILFGVLARVPEGQTGDEIRTGAFTQAPATNDVSRSTWVTGLDEGICVNTGKIAFRVTPENILEQIQFDANATGGYEASELMIQHGDLLLRQNGLDFQSSQSRARVELLETSEVKCRLAVSGSLINPERSSGVIYRLEIEAFRNQSYLFISPTVEILPQDELRVAKLHLSLFTPAHLESCHFGEKLELQHVVIHDWVRLIQERPEFYKVTNQKGTFADGAMSQGWVDVLNGDKNIMIYQENWSSAPKGFLLRGNEILVYLWSPHAGFMPSEKLGQFGSDGTSGTVSHRILLYFHPDGLSPQCIGQTIATCAQEAVDLKVSPVMGEIK